MPPSDISSAGDAASDDCLSAKRSRGFVVAAALVAATFIAAVWIWAGTGRMWFFDVEYPRWHAKAIMLRECSHADTVILGDSRPVAGLIPEQMGDDVTNLALGGGTPIESFYAAEQMLKCAAPPTRVILSFAPMHLMMEDSYWTRTALFGFMTFEQMEAVREKSRHLSDGSVYPLGVTYSAVGLLKNVSYAVSFPPYYFPAMINAGFFARKRQNDQLLELTFRTRGHNFFGTAERSNWPAYDTRMPKFVPSPILDFYLDKSIALLTRNRVEVYYVSMPVNELTFRGLREDLEVRLAQYLSSFEQRYPGFRIAGEILPHLPTDNFGDPVHLNERGARLWSRRVAKAIAEASTDERGVGTGRQ